MFFIVDICISLCLRAPRKIDSSIGLPSLNKVVTYLLTYSIVDRHRCHMAAKFGLFVDEDHNRLPTLYWLPKLHKRPYKSRFIANSSACTTTELSILLTSCLTAIKKTMSLNIAQQFMKEMVKIYFGLLKILVKFLIN